ncbi:GNAT family N-acetyltransferase [Marivita sp. S2033]|uniref:GNAT family N-acetyltransferase n=1 Tax=Marivita sp. S2033 TaxID=3373187 RepID=UPI0039827873
MAGYVFKRIVHLNADAVSLIERHAEMMRAATPAESCHVLEIDEMIAPDIQVYGLESQSGNLLAIGALKTLTPEHGEVKSIHTSSHARQQGVGDALLANLLKQARVEGFRRLSLETGSDAQFSAARRLFARHGFQSCPPFGPYVEDPQSVFMTVDI